MQVCLSLVSQAGRAKGGSQTSRLKIAVGEPFVPEGCQPSHIKDLASAAYTAAKTPMAAG